MRWLRTSQRHRQPPSSPDPRSGSEGWWQTELTGVAHVKVCMHCQENEKKMKKNARAKGCDRRIQQAQHTQPPIFSHTHTQILMSRCPSIFTISRPFSRVSVLIHLPYLLVHLLYQVSITLRGIKKGVPAPCECPTSWWSCPRTRKRCSWDRGQNPQRWRRWCDRLAVPRALSLANHFCGIKKSYYYYYCYYWKNRHLMMMMIKTDIWWWGWWRWWLKW